MEEQQIRKAMKMVKPGEPFFVTYFSPLMTNAPFKKEHPGMSIYKCTGVNTVSGLRYSDLEIVKKAAAETGMDKADFDDPMYTRDKEQPGFFSWRNGKMYLNLFPTEYWKKSPSYYGMFDANDECEEMYESPEDIREFLTPSAYNRITGGYNRDAETGEFKMQPIIRKPIDRVYDIDVAMGESLEEDAPEAKVPTFDELTGNTTDESLNEGTYDRDTFFRVYGAVGDGTVAKAKKALDDAGIKYETMTGMEICGSEAKGIPYEESLNETTTNTAVPATVQQQKLKAQQSVNAAQPKTAATAVTSTTTKNTIPTTTETEEPAVTQRGQGIRVTTANANSTVKDMARKHNTDVLNKVADAAREDVGTAEPKTTNNISQAPTTTAADTAATLKKQASTKPDMLQTTKDTASHLTAEDARKMAQNQATIQQSRTQDPAAGSKALVAKIAAWANEKKAANQSNTATTNSTAQQNTSSNTNSLYAESLMEAEDTNWAEDVDTFAPSKEEQFNAIYAESSEAAKIIDNIIEDYGFEVVEYNDEDCPVFEDTEIYEEILNELADRSEGRFGTDDEEAYVNSDNIHHEVRLAPSMGDYVHHDAGKYKITDPAEIARLRAHNKEVMKKNQELLDKRFNDEWRDEDDRFEDDDL